MQTPSVNIMFNDLVRFHDGESMHVGYRGEVLSMIAHNPLLSEAARYHARDVWGLTRNMTKDDHERLGHIPFTLMRHTHPELVAHIPNNGSFESEIYADAIGNHAEGLNASVRHKRNDCIFIAQSAADVFFSTENQVRILAALLALKEKRSAFDIYKECSFEPKALARYALLKGVRIRDVKESDVDAQISRDVTYLRGSVIEDDEYGTFVIFHASFWPSKGTLMAHKYIVITPDQFCETYGLKLFEIPSKDAIGAFYDAALPMMKFLRLQERKKRDVRINDVVAVLKQSKIAASHAPARIGHKGEVSDIAARPDMSVIDMAAFMRANWGFEKDMSVQHEFGHGVLALLSLTHPELLKCMYQGNFTAESYVVQIEGILSKTPDWLEGCFYDDRKGFAREVAETSHHFYTDENLNRVLGWLLADGTAESAWDVLYRYGFDKQKLIDAAHAAKKIDVRDVHGDGFELEIISPAHGSFKIYSSFRESDSKIHIDIPDALSGDEVFVPYEPITLEEAGAMYDALAPVLHFVQGKIFERWDEFQDAKRTKNTAPCFERLYESITAGDLITALNSGKAAPAPDAPIPDSPEPVI